MAQITYADKTAMNVNSSVPDINKVNASDMNEIKLVVNNNYTELLNAINDKNIMTAYFTSNYTLPATSAYYKLPINSSKVVGTKLTLDTTNHNVVVGAGVSQVKVSAKVCFNSIASSGDKWLNIYRNNEAVSANPQNLSGRDMIYSTTMLVDVQQNDIIYLSVYGTKNDVIRANISYTNITIEVIE